MQVRSVRSVALCVSLFAFAGASSAQDAQAVYKNALPSIMTLKVVKKDGSIVLGTAFLATKEGCAVTAWHIVEGAKSVAARFSDNEEFESTGLIDQDEKRDLALIRVKVAGRPLLRFSESDPEIGSKAFVIGAPQGLEFSISDGIVSQIRQIEGMKQYQYSAPSNSGNSGGPLLNPLGEVLGIVSWKLRNTEGLSFAIAGVYARALDSSLPTQVWEAVKPSNFVGFSTSAQDAKLATDVLRIRVEANSHINAAWDLNREITRVSARRLTIPASAFQAIDGLRRLSREIKELRFSDAEINKAVDAASENYSNAATGFENVRDACLYAMRSGWDNYSNSLSNKGFGLIFSPRSPWIAVRDQLKKLTPPNELAKYHADFVTALFGDGTGWPKIRQCGLVLDLRAVPGLLVAAAVPGSPSDKCDFRPSDLILAIDGKEVSGWTALEDALSAAVGKSVNLRVRRMKGGESTLKLTVPN